LFLAGFEISSACQPGIAKAYETIRQPAFKPAENFGFNFFMALGVKNTVITSAFD